MAKKKEQEFKYLNMPLHEGQSKTKHIKVNWSGLDYRSENDTGYLVYEKNISTAAAPCLMPSDKSIKKLSFGKLATSWNKPEDKFETYTPKEMTINGEKCYGLDFENNTVLLCYDGVGAGYDFTVELPDGTVKKLPYSQGAVMYVKKIYSTPYLTQTAQVCWSYIKNAVRIYTVPDNLTDRNKLEILASGIYYDDLGYIVSNIHSYKNLLFVCYYSWWECNTAATPQIGYVTASCIVYNADSMEEITSPNKTGGNTHFINFKLGEYTSRSGEETYGEARLYSDIPEIKMCVFNALKNSLTLAEYNTTSDIVKKSLFFPASYSLTLDRVENIIYRSETRSSKYNSAGAIYPYAFIDDFKDVNITYNVIENPACKIPQKKDLNRYYQGGGFWWEYEECGDFKITDNDDDNASWILGYWKYDKTECKWLPAGYDKLEKKKKNTLPQTEKITGTPFLKDVCVYHSRLFGINDVGVYASEYGDYSGWSLDDADEYNSSNAWMSLITSDEVKAGMPTAITVYQDAVIVFCEKHIYEIRNKKNPFRIIDIFDEGCISSNACCVVNGYLLFANENGARMYTGSKPKDIGYKLGFNKIYYASCGSDGTRWYLYCETDKKEHNLFVYDTITGFWSEKEIKTKLISFATTTSGVFALSSNNDIYLLNSKEYDEQEWACETDFTSGGTLDIKHIKKIQMLADVGAKSKIEIHILTDDEKFDELTQSEVTERCVYSFLNNSEKTKTAVIRVIPRKTANYKYKLRISGTGYSKVYQADISVQTGGELFDGQIR